MRLRIQIDKDIAIDYKTEGTPDEFRLFMYGFLEWHADKIVKRINEVMKRQLYNWKPLSPDYQRWKESMGLDPRVWVASHYTRKAIHYWYSPLGDSFFVGVHPTLKHREYVRGGINPKQTTVRLLDLIRWLEFGTTRMPARPLFTKVFAEFRPKKRQEELYAEFIKEQKGLI